MSARRRAAKQSSWARASASWSGRLIAQKTEAEVSRPPRERAHSAWTSRDVFSPSANSMPTPAQRAAAAKRMESRASRRSGRSRKPALTMRRTTIRAEKASVEEQLKQSQDERVKLQREIAVMKREAETHGPTSAWKMRCCASASTTLQRRWQGSLPRSKGRARRLPQLSRATASAAAAHGRQWRVPCRLRQRSANRRARLPIVFARCRAAPRRSARRASLKAETAARRMIPPFRRLLDTPPSLPINAVPGPGA